MKTRLKSDLNMEQATGGLAYCTKPEHGKLSGITAKYVGDTIGTGDETFERDSMITERVFE